MSELLYYQSANRFSFDARVVSCRQGPRSWETVLDRTAFYPTSGGQPFDTGTLGTADVIDVVDGDDGAASRGA